jgi:hypothetical protein
LLTASGGGSQMARLQQRWQPAQQLRRRRFMNGDLSSLWRPRIVSLNPLWPVKESEMTS